MQQVGTLRKRSQRILVKVNGLGAVAYQEGEDEFKPSLILSQPPSHPCSNRSSTSSTGRIKNSERITRQPKYHQKDLEANENPPLTEEDSECVERNHNRPYLLSTGTYNTLRVVIFLGGLCLNTPWCWNKNRHKVDPWNPFFITVWRFYWYFTSIQSTIMLVYHVYGVISMLSPELKSYRIVFEYSINVVRLCVIWDIRHVFFMYEDKIRKYINSLIAFNQEYVDKYLVYGDKYVEFSSARLIMKFSIVAAATNIVNSLFVFLAMPNKIYYLTSRINPRPWYALIPGAIQDITFFGQMMLSYITFSWLQVIHASSIQFWLREMHKDAHSDYTLGTLRTPSVSVPTYRALQLMCTNFNECMATWCLPVWKFTAAFGLISCGYLCIRSMNNLFVKEFPGSLVYLVGSLQCFTMAFGCLTEAAEMYDIANSFINSWSRTKQKDFRRVLMSCPTLKVNVGRYYVLTAATTITYFQVVTGFIIDCLLTLP